jgi:hypothetical protein
MGHDLGSLGTEHEPLEIRFDWFGTKIRANPFVSDTVGVDFAERATGIHVPEEIAGLSDEQMTPEQLRTAQRAMNDAMTMVKGLVREVIHTDDFETYWRIGREHGQTMDDHMRVVKTITELVGKERSESSPGSSTTTGPESPENFVRRVSAGRPDRELGLMTDLFTARRLREESQGQEAAAG